MKYRLTLAALAVLSVSCIRQVRVAQAPGPRGTPPPVNAWDRQIRNAKDAGDGDYALRVLRERVAAEPDNLAVRLELAKGYQDRGYPDVALEMCRLASARFPESGEAALALARALRDTNRREDAIASLETFLGAHPPGTAEYYSWLGILRDEAGRFAAAEQSHRQALAAAPAEDALHNNLGYNLLMQQKYEAAAAEFRAALELNPGSPVARNNLGLALADLEQPAQAVATWQAAAGPATAHNNLAAVLIGKARYPEARKELEIALGYDRSHPAALKNLELVSRLDGKETTLARKPEESFWKRFRTGLLRVLVGPSQNLRTDTAKTASAAPSGEER